MLLALATLVLLPGLLVVRAPWTAVPALSLAFWALSAWWPPLASASRERVMLGALLVFAPLVLLRLVPKHEVPPPPGVAPPPALDPPPRPGLAPPSLRCAESALVLAAALALALPGQPWSNAPGPDAAFQTTAARLYLWRDAIPANLEPLLPLAPFGAHSPAVATLAGDLARVSGADPGEAVAVVLATAAAAALLGLFALHAAWAPPPVAALGALAGMALAPWPQWLSAWGTADAPLALAFLLPAVALVIGHASRASAVGAGFLLAAGALAQPVLALAAAASAAVLTLLAPAGLPARAARVSQRRRGPVRRLALVLGSALVFGLPGLRPLADALSWAEATGAARALLPADTAWFAAGLAALVLGPLAARPLARADRRLAGAAAVLSAALLAFRVHGWFAAGQLAPADAAALREASSRGPRLEALCAPDGLRDWVPAIAGRPAGEPGPWIPAEYRDEWRSRSRRDCVPLRR